MISIGNQRPLVIAQSRAVGSSTTALEINAARGPGREWQRLTPSRWSMVAAAMNQPSG
jgi:hypothetical protein